MLSLPLQPGAGCYGVEQVLLTQVFPAAITCARQQNKTSTAFPCLPSAALCRHARVA